MNMINIFNRALAEKIDQDSNGTITEKELGDWIERNHIAYVVKRSRTFFEDTDEDVDGFVTFAEYEKSQYNHRKCLVTCHVTFCKCSPKTNENIIF